MADIKATKAVEQVRTGSRSAVVWLSLLIYLLGLVQVVGLTRFGNYLGIHLALTAVFMLGFLGTMHCMVRPRGEGLLHLPSRGWLLACLLPLVVVNPIIQVALDSVFERFGYDLQPVSFGFYVGITLLVGSFVVWLGTRQGVSGMREARHQPWVLVLAALILAAGAQWVAIVSFPLRPDVSDMLPSIEMAVRRWLEGGGLYGPLDLGTHSVWTPYLPVLEVAYAPLVWMGADLRWLSLIGLAGVALIAYGATLQRSLGLATAIAAFLVSPLLVMRHDLYLAPLWLLLALFGAAVAQRRWWLASTALGLSLATQQLSVLLLPFYTILLWRQRGAARSVVHLLLAALLALVILTVFVWPAPTEFVYGVFGRYQASPAPDAPLSLSTRAVGGRLSLASLVYLLVGSRWGLILQVLSFAGVCLIGWQRICEPADGLMWAAVGQAVFLLLNKPPWNWAYFYVSVLLLLLFAVIAKECEGVLASIGRPLNRAGEPRLL